MFESFIASAPPALRNSAKVCELCSFAVFRHLPSPFLRNGVCRRVRIAALLLPGDEEVWGYFSVIGSQPKHQLTCIPCVGVVVVHLCTVSLAFHYMLFSMTPAKSNQPDGQGQPSLDVCLQHQRAWSCGVDPCKRSMIVWCNEQQIHLRFLASQWYFISSFVFYPRRWLAMAPWRRCHIRSRSMRTGCKQNHCLLSLLQLNRLT